MKFSFLHSCIFTALLTSSFPILAEDALDKVVAEHINHEPANMKPKTVEPNDNLRETLPTALPTEASAEEKKIVLTPQYLQEHPEELEQMLLVLVQTSNANGLRLLLPIYQQVPNHDESMIDWGSAIIAANEGKIADAIRLFRKINAALPEIKLLRFQMATLLFADGQYDAAESEFEKLRSENLPKQDEMIIEQYLAAIDARDNWSFNGNLSFLNDKNLNNAPAIGTTIVGENGSFASYRRPYQTGYGVNYFLSADKKWTIKDRFFTAAHLSSYGSIYFNNAPYNDLTARLGWGFGYRTNKGEVEITPFVQGRWYGGGEGGSNSLKDYAKTSGLRLDLSYRILPKWFYQGSIEYSRDQYIDDYKHQNGNTYIVSNSISYAPNQNQYWYLGWDYIRKEAKQANYAYKRSGLRGGWGQEWPKGISTRMSLGVAKKNYDGKDFFNIRQQNTEYNTKLSLWHRALYFWGITPRLVFNYNKVDSNHPFYNYHKGNVSLEFSKRF